MPNNSGDIADRLLLNAWNARKNAWAPYSGFRVGAALYLPAQDVVITGVNVENASFGGTICAERAAIVSAISQYGKQTIAMLLVATDCESPAVPCALCLQVLAEFCAPTMPILIANAAGIRERFVFADLLPRPFVSFSVGPYSSSTERGL